MAQCHRCGLSFHLSSSITSLQCRHYKQQSGHFDTRISSIHEISR